MNVLNYKVTASSFSQTSMGYCFCEYQPLLIYQTIPSVSSTHLQELQLLACSPCKQSSFPFFIPTLEGMNPNLIPIRVCYEPPISHPSQQPVISVYVLHKCDFECHDLIPPVIQVFFQRSKRDRQRKRGKRCTFLRSGRWRSRLSQTEEG